MKAVYQKNIIIENTGIGSTMIKNTALESTEILSREAKRRENVFCTVSAEAQKAYSLRALLIIFFSVSFTGWLWEVTLHFCTSGNLVNRGTLHGPWLPIYGTAAVFLVLFLRKSAARPLKLLAETIAACGIIEYATSVVLELLFKTRWWDYSDMPLNIEGRVCIGGLLLFGFGGLAVIYVIGPALRKKAGLLPKKAALALGVILVLIFLADVTLSFTNIRTGAGITAAGF